MSQTVNVLTPNGRRQNVKVSPNTTVLQILEEVCLKQRFDPSAYDLKHGRNVTDATSTFRFSGIPNNAKLEMVERESRRSCASEVTIALQLASGERRQNQFTTDTTLSQMVKSFQKSDGELLDSGADMMPVIIFMRDEVVGLEALNQTTLKDLGILSGKTMLRLVHRPLDQSILNKVSHQLDAERKKIEKYKSVEPTSNPTANPPDVRPKVTQAAKSQIHNRSTEPNQEPMEVSNITPSITQSTVTATDASNQDVMSSSDPPIQIHTTSSVVRTDDVMEVTAGPSQAQEGASSRSPHTIDTRPHKLQKIEQPIRIPQPVPMEFKFPEATAGQSLYVNDISGVQKSDFLPCDRETVLYDPEEYVECPTEEVAMDDDFYEVTKDDLQKIIKDLREQIYADENAPLMTSAMRQAKLEASSSKYDSAVIRLHFPDKLILQAKFKPRETVHSLKKFVKSHLHKTEDSFYLYITPPKQILKDDAMTLIQAHLVPLSVVHVGFNQTSGGYLKEETLKLKQTRAVADSKAKSILPAVTRNTSREVPVPKQARIGASGTVVQPIRSPAQSSNSSASAASTSKLPKWYKPSGK